MSKKKTTKRKPKKTVTTTPPACPHCGHQKHLKKRGAHREIDSQATGEHVAWFYVTCCDCDETFVLRQVTKMANVRN